MISSFVDAIKNFLGAVASLLGLMQARDARKNAPDMQRAAQGKTDQQLRDEANQAIAEKDLDAIRRQNS